MGFAKNHNFKAQFRIMNVLIESLWPDNLIAQFIVFIIPILVGLVSLLTFHNVRRFGRELKAIQLVESNLDKWLDSIGQTDYESEEADTIDVVQIIAKVPIELLKKKVNPSTLICQRLSTIERLEQFHIKLNVESLQNLSIANEDRNWSVKAPGILISISIMLGMLGTFVGLSIMVSNIVSTLPEGTEDLSGILNATSKMREMMSGVNSAFSTTLLGLFGTIVATILNVYVEQKQITVFSTLENFTINKLLPHTIPNIEDENVLENITHNLETSFSNLETTIGHNWKILSELGQVQEGFKVIVDDVRKLTIKESSNELSGVINHLVEMNTRLKEVATHYDIKYKNVQELERIAGKQIADYNKMMFDLTKLPGWFRWVLITLITIAFSTLTFVGFLIYNTIY